MAETGTWFRNLQQELEKADNNIDQINKKIVSDFVAIHSPLKTYIEKSKKKNQESDIIARSELIHDKPCIIDEKIPRKRKANH